MKVSERIEDFRQAVELRLTDSPDMRVIVEVNSTYLDVMAEYQTTDGKYTYYTLGSAHLPRPDLRKPIPYQLVDDAIRQIRGDYRRKSQDPRYTPESKERARQALELCQP